MNSKLNLALREKHGYVYSVEANYSPYIDTGLFSIFFGTDPKLVNKSIKVVLKEMQKLSEKPLGIMQLHKAKEQLMGQLAMSEENNASLMLMMGKSLLDLERIQSLEEIFAEIGNVTALNLQGVATEMFVENELSNLNFLPKN